MTTAGGSIRRRWPKRWGGMRSRFRFGGSRRRNDLLGASLMNRSLGCLTLLMILVTARWAAADETAAAKAGARFRNERLAEQARPAERSALLAVTNAGANVILDSDGSVVSVQLEGCVFPDSVLSVLKELPRLKQLQLGHSKVTDA